MTKDWKIKWWQKKLLRWLCKGIVTQSGEHKSNIIEYYRIMHYACRDHFNEDNVPTLNAFLEDCHKEELECH